MGASDLTLNDTIQRFSWGSIILSHDGQITNNFGAGALNTGAAALDLFREPITSICKWACWKQALQSEL